MSVDRVDAPSVPVVQRWRRYGHDRAYVRVGEQQLGYRDLKTGDVHTNGDGDAQLIGEVTADLWDRAKAARYVPRHAGRELPSEPSVPAPPLEPDYDLARNVPGQAAQAQANALRAAAPVRTFLARAVGAKTDERSWRIGADGEEEIARRIAKLPPDWQALYAIPVGERGSDIDAIVIGPGGVFTINAKRHPNADVWVGGDSVKVNGSSQRYVRNSRHEVDRAARLLAAAAALDVAVRGIVAITGHRKLTSKAQPADGTVAVLSAKELTTFLRAQPTILDEPTAARLYAAARHLATWQPKTVQRQNFDE